MKVKKVLVSFFVGVCLFGTTAIAGNGSFNFGVHTGGPEVNAGAWINKGISENYAQVTTNSFAGYGALLYVKNSSYVKVSEEKSISGKGYAEVDYTKTAPIGKNYQLYAKSKASSASRSTSLSGIWTP